MNNQAECYTDIRMINNKPLCDTEARDLINNLGKTIEGMAAPKLSELENDLVSVMPFYDTIITSQEEFESMLASENWGDAKYIFLNCDISLGAESIQTVIQIPDNVLLINGNGNTMSGDYYSLYGGSRTVIKNTKLHIERGRIERFYGLVNCDFSLAWFDDPMVIDGVIHIIGCNCSDNNYGEGKANLNNCMNLWTTTEQSYRFSTVNSPYIRLHITDTIPVDVDKKYIEDTIGDIEEALDSILALQNSLIGGDV